MRSRFLLLLALSLAGCECGRKAQVSERFAEIGIPWTDPDGAEVVNRDATFDFGMALVGDRVARKLIVRNVGSGPLTLVSLERVEGDPVTIADASEMGSAFEVRFAPGSSLAPLEEAAFDMVFTPTRPAEAGLDHYARLLLKGGGTRPGEGEATIVLKGSSGSSTCQLPKLLDFGKVASGAFAELPYDVPNQTALPATGAAGEPTSATGDHQAFTFAASSPRGSFPVPPNGATRLTFRFSPTEVRAYQAAVKVRAAAGCPEVEVTLEGEGVDTVLSWTPSQLDFGAVGLSKLYTRELTFFNAGATPLKLTQLATTMASDFGVVAGPGGNPSELEIPPGSVPTPLTVGCRPSSLGPRTAQLTFQTGIAKQPSGSVGLKCYGGGPKISVMPRPTLAFGKVGYFANTTPPASVVRKLTVMNVGARPNPPDPNVNLRLGSVGPKGPGQLPYLALTPQNASTAPGEFSVGIPSSYDPAVGLEATVGKNLVDLVVTLTPASLGAKEAEVTIFSNDPDEPQVKIRLTADAVQVPPCRYSVSPAQLNFGLVTPPSFKELPVVIRNLSQTAGDICLVSGVDLSSSTDPAYSLIGGPVPSRELQPNESWQLTVKVWPQGPQPQTTVSLLGHLQFSISSPQSPQGSVPLITAVGPSCLTIAPDKLDFGTVKKGCNSSTKTFSIYNTCTQNVTITSFAMQAGAGQIAGGPDCPGTQPCPEFHLVSTPAIFGSGLTLQPGASPVTFQAKYSPIDMGADSGAVAINAIQGGQNVVYLVTLQGKGDATGLHTDVFTQSAKPEADILLTIDNSCSMGDEQSSLANNFAAFIQYANSTNADYHLGVTTTDDDEPMQTPLGPMGGGERGRLLGDANNPKVLTPTTPDVENKFKAKVKVGTNGSASETGISPSLKAVTAPLVTADNAGFLRFNAYLAVVVVTDAIDQDPKPVSYFYNQFLNVKGVNRANLFTFNVIGPFDPNPPTGCSYDGSSDDGRYAQMVSLTNGVREEICNANWAQKLQDLGKVAFGYRTSFFLNSTPDQSGGKTIEVKVNGVVVPSTDWTYDPVANAIVFNAGKAPGAGQTLSVSYTVACL
ncbi:MAG: choice-of-anchor D domain-containing protein [Myxococcales bacterium]|nr:choice-of-anchor D domain-containing protein [Myxococcales bacterium]